ncbi:MAG: hypothetical protein JJ866_15790 [Roseibium sp.]|uniref:hypothetical protein n=1 Tax=Roseibium sp. TaxID=1936156 RepID=UPI001B2E9964|nr:hypothetical protein [Roseibium sp.]MBO6893405.1 hypothetical protein [Roseibium sp.]MBO6930719.1 hypothetical protein [Roseibium sp.]
MAKKQPASKSAEPEVSFVGITLLDLKLDFNPGLEEAKDVAFNYAVHITRPQDLGGDLFTFRATVSVVKQEKDSDERSTSFEASYLCGMRGKNCDCKYMEDFALFFAKTSAWTHFTSLASIVTQQMRATFPFLPVAPSFVEFEDESSET